MGETKGREMGQAACSERRDHRLFIDKRTTRRVDEDGARPHHFDALPGQEVLGIVVQKQVQGDDMTLNQQLLERHESHTGMPL